MQRGTEGWSVCHQEVLSTKGPLWECDNGKERRSESGTSTSVRVMLTRRNLDVHRCWYYWLLPGTLCLNSHLLHVGWLVLDAEKVMWNQEQSFTVSPLTASLFTTCSFKDRTRRSAEGRQRGDAEEWMSCCGSNPLKSHSPCSNEAT